MGVIDLIPEMATALANGGAIYVKPEYLPMLVKPKPWNNQVGVGGYFRLKAGIVKSESALQQKAMKKANIPRVLTALDYLGQTPWRINSFILDVDQSIYKNGGDIAAIPTRKDQEGMDEQEFYRMMDEEEKKEEELKGQ